MFGLAFVGVGFFLWRRPATRARLVAAAGRKAGAARARLGDVVGRKGGAEGGTKGGAKGGAKDGATRSKSRAPSTARPKTLPRMAADMEGSLPAGWVAIADPTSGDTYYYHEATETTQWEAPEAAAKTDTKAASEAMAKNPLGGQGESSRISLRIEKGESSLE